MNTDRKNNFIAPEEERTHTFVDHPQATLIPKIEQRFQIEKLTDVNSYISNECTQTKIQSARVESKTSLQLNLRNKSAYRHSPCKHNQNLQSRPS